jgi:hypothetical protein
VDFRASEVRLDPGVTKNGEARSSHSAPTLPRRAAGA